MRSLVFSVIFTAVVHLTNGSPMHIQKRAAFYIANETACVVDNTVYFNGDPIPTDDPCEACKCRPPGFACVLKDCEKKPGCRAVRRAGQCCPEYICGCEHNGRMYRDGDEIQDNKNPCYTCHCQGSSIACAFVDCFFRVDCAPEYVPGECCPHYNHCSELDEDNVSSFDDADFNPLAFATTPQSIDSTEGHLTSESPNAETFPDEDKVQELDTTPEQTSTSKVEYADEATTQQTIETEGIYIPNTNALSHESTEVNINNNKIEKIEEAEDLLKTAAELDKENSEDTELTETSISIPTESYFITSTSDATSINAESFSTAQSILEEISTHDYTDETKTNEASSTNAPLVNEKPEDEPLIKRFRSLENQTEELENQSRNASSTEMSSTDVPKPSQLPEPSELPEDKIAEYLRSLRKASTSASTQQTTTKSDLMEETTVVFSNQKTEDVTALSNEATTISEATVSNDKPSNEQENETPKPLEVHEDHEVAFKAMDVTENTAVNEPKMDQDSTTEKADAFTSLQTTKSEEVEQTSSTIAALSTSESTTVAPGTE